MTSLPIPTLVPLGDAALLIRFGTTLSEPANRAAVDFSRALSGRLPDAVTE
ncbi:MAG: allophanate hydrolase subunit 1, partial [Hyphomicrobiales bacterium]